MKFSLSSKILFETYHNNITIIPKKIFQFYSKIKLFVYKVSIIMFIYTQQKRDKLIIIRSILTLFLSKNYSVLFKVIFLFYKHHNVYTQRQKYANKIKHLRATQRKHTKVSNNTDNIKY